MAGIKEGVALAEPLYRYIRTAYDESEWLPPEALRVLQHAVSAFEVMLGSLDLSDGPMPDHTELFAEIDTLHEDLETTLLAARASEAASEITFETEALSDDAAAATTIAGDDEPAELGAEPGRPLSVETIDPVRMYR